MHTFSDHFIGVHAVVLDNVVLVVMITTMMLTMMKVVITMIKQWISIQ